MPQRLLGIGVNEFPPASPIATPTAWIGPTITGTCTYASSTTVTVITPTAPIGAGATTTQFTGVDNMVVGQLWFGGGVPAGTTIATIVSATSVTLSAAATVSASTQPFTTGPGLPTQSIYGYLTTGNAVEPVTNVVGDSFLSIPNVQTIVTLQHYYIPPGQGICLLTAGATNPVTYQYQNPNGTWVTITSVAAAATASFPYISDGINFRINNAATASSTATFFQTN
jgi:hypothetical protein